MTVELTVNSLSYSLNHCLQNGMSYIVLRKVIQYNGGHGLPELRDTKIDVELLDTSEMNYRYKPTELC